MNNIFFINFKNSTTGTGGVGTTSRDMLAKYPGLHFIFWDGSDVLRSSDLSIKVNNEKFYSIHNNYFKSYIWQALHAMPVNIEETDLSRPREDILRETLNLSKKIFNFAHSLSKEPIYWVNDYTAFYLVSGLRKIDKASTIVFSFRTPFGKEHYPAFFNEDKSLFCDLLLADIITFHRNKDRNLFKEFIKNNSTQAVVLSKNWIKIGDHRVVLKVLPEGNNKEYRRSLLKSPKTAFFANYFKMRYSTKPIIASISRFEFSKGIDYQLDLIEYLLQTYPELIGTFYFFAYTYLSPNKKKDLLYNQFFKQVKNKVHNINRVYGNDKYTPVVLENRKLNDYEVTGLLSQASILLIPSYSDGFNHVASEAVFSHTLSFPIQLILGDIGVSDYIKGQWNLEHDLNHDSRTLAEMLNSVGLIKKIRFARLLRSASKLSSEQWFDSIIDLAKKVQASKK